MSVDEVKGLIIKVIVQVSARFPDSACIDPQSNSETVQIYGEIQTCRVRWNILHNTSSTLVYRYDKSPDPTTHQLSMSQLIPEEGIRHRRQGEPHNITLMSLLLGLAVHDGGRREVSARSNPSKKRAAPDDEGKGVDEDGFWKLFGPPKQKKEKESRKESRGDFCELVML